MEAATIRSHSLTRSLSLVQTAHAPMCLCACLGRKKEGRGEIATFLFLSVCLSVSLSLSRVVFLARPLSISISGKLNYSPPAVAQRRCPLSFQIKP